MPEVRMAAHDICDFCSDPKPARIFNAPDFMMAKDAPPAMSRGGWIACQTCGEFIDAGKWDALQARAVEAFAAKYFGFPRKAIVQQVAKAHSLFRQHMRRDA